MLKLFVMFRCRSDSWLADVYATTPVMSTYLLCILVGEFVHVEAKWHNVTTYPVYTFII